MRAIIVLGTLLAACLVTAGPGMATHDLIALAGSFAHEQVAPAEEAIAGAQGAIDAHGQAAGGIAGSAAGQAPNPCVLPCIPLFLQALQREAEHHLVEAQEAGADLAFELEGQALAAAGIAAWVAGMTLDTAVTIVHMEKQAIDASAEMAVACPDAEHPGDCVVEASEPLLAL